MTDTGSLHAERLTQYSHGAGCACKLDPSRLARVVRGLVPSTRPELLVGPQTGDDAAVWKLDDDRALVVTADFITPVVDDARDWGRVAAANAASDVYAPITGEVLEVNDALAAEPALVNSDAGGKAWFFKLKIADKSELGGLMDEAAYAKHTA